MEKLKELLDATLLLQDEDKELFDTNYKAMIEYYNIMVNSYPGLMYGLLGKEFNGQIVHHRNANEIRELTQEQKIKALRILSKLIDIL